MQAPVLLRRRAPGPRTCALANRAFDGKGRSGFTDYMAAYGQRRGMDFHHDVHDCSAAGLMSPFHRRKPSDS